MQCACAILSTVACPALPYFSTLSLFTYFREEKKLMERKMCFHFICNFCLQHSHPEYKRGRLPQIYVRLHVRYPSFMSTYHATWISHRFSKNTQISIFMKIYPVGAGFHADGRTDRHDEANSRFFQFCELAEKLLVYIKAFSGLILSYCVVR